MTVIDIATLCSLYTSLATRGVTTARMHHHSTTSWTMLLIIGPYYLIRIINESQTCAILWSCRWFKRAWWAIRSSNRLSTIISVQAIRALIDYRFISLVNWEITAVELTIEANLKITYQNRTIRFRHLANETINLPICRLWLRCSVNTSNRD